MVEDKQITVVDIPEISSKTTLMINNAAFTGPRVEVEVTTVASTTMTKTTTIKIGITRKVLMAFQERISVREVVTATN